MTWVRAAAAGLLIVLAACAERDDDADMEVPAAAPAEAPPEPASAESSVSTVTVTLTEWSVALSEDSIPAGTVTFQIRNGGAVEHRFEVEAEEGEGEWSTDGLAPGASVTMSVNLEAGVYEAYCPVVAGGVNHKERGMRTRLRVY